MPQHLHCPDVRNTCAVQVTPRGALRVPSRGGTEHRKGRVGREGTTVKIVCRVEVLGIGFWKPSGFCILTMSWEFLKLLAGVGSVDKPMRPESGFACVRRELRMSWAIEFCSRDHCYRSILICLSVLADLQRRRVRLVRPRPYFRRRQGRVRAEWWMDGDTRSRRLPDRTKLKRATKRK